MSVCLSVCLSVSCCLLSDFALCLCVALMSVFLSICCFLLLCMSHVAPSVAPSGDLLTRYTTELSLHPAQGRYQTLPRPHFWPNILFFFFFLFVCFTRYLVFRIVVLPHRHLPHQLLRRETRIPGIVPFSFRISINVLFQLTEGH